MAFYQNHLKHILILGCLLLSNYAYEQDISQISKRSDIQAFVRSSKDNLPLPYVKVYNKSTGDGTLTNQDGFFKIKLVSEYDTLIFSFTGYEKTSIIASSIESKSSVILSEETTMLGIVNVLSEDAYLYEMVSKCQEIRGGKVQIGKTYFGLETFINDNQVEQLECYYNGSVSGYDVVDLELKKGRSALNVEDEMLFVSLDISKAFYMHQLFRKNKNSFPHNPFEYRKRTLRKKYSLRLTAKYQDEDSNTICAISFDPKSDVQSYFKGTVWIDSSSLQLRKIELNIENANIYPFSDNWLQSDYEGIYMTITKTFEIINDMVVLNAIYFDYDVNYKLQIGRKDTISRATRSVLHVFNYEEPFLLPFFEFPTSADDYRKISASRYDPLFWNAFSEFRINTENNKNELFFKNADYTNEDLFEPRGLSSTRESFYVSEYIYWDYKRVFFSKNLVKDSVIDKMSKAGVGSSALYNLEVQIYMDIIELDDTIYVDTKTIFDPFETYYYHPITYKTHVFINAYFDLIEIHRRELMVEIQAGEQSIDAIKDLYEKRMQIVKLESAKFLHQVNRGENALAIGKWNAYIWKKLHIDNIEIFSPPEEEKEQSD